MSIHAQNDAGRRYTTQEKKQICTRLSYYDPVEIVLQHALCMQPFMLSMLIVGTGCPGLICSAVLATSAAHPWGMKVSLLYGLLNWGEAYLISTWLMREQRLAQAKISHSIN